MQWEYQHQELRLQEALIVWVALAQPASQSSAAIATVDGRANIEAHMKPRNPNAGALRHYPSKVREDKRHIKRRRSQRKRDAEQEQRDNG